MAEQLASEWLVLNPQIVQQALARLIALKVHPQFPGYLCVLYTARVFGRPVALRPDFKSFFERYLKVEGASKRKPYVQPFSDQKKGKRSPFFNENVAGSYAPSSLREDVAPFAKVVITKGSRSQATYDLVPSHAEEAFKHLLLGQKMPAVSLAIFLYRDYGFKRESGSLVKILETFRDDFGLTEEKSVKHEKGEATFEQLFYDDSSDFEGNELFLTNQG